MDVSDVFLPGGGRMASTQYTGPSHSSPQFPKEIMVMMMMMSLPQLYILTIVVGIANYNFMILPHGVDIL